jgi:hypothetical protein
MFSQNVTVFRDRAFKRQIKLNEAIRVGFLYRSASVLIGKGDISGVFTYTGKAR